jgi:hypothetical protein
MDPWKEVLRESNIDSRAQKPIAQRDNHKLGCWITNLVITHQKG